MRSITSIQDYIQVQSNIYLIVHTQYFQRSQFTAISLYPVNREFETKHIDIFKFLNNQVQVGMFNRQRMSVGLQILYRHFTIRKFTNRKTCRTQRVCPAMTILVFFYWFWVPHHFCDKQGSNPFPCGLDLRTNGMFEECFTFERKSKNLLTVSNSKYQHHVHFLHVKYNKLKFEQPLNMRKPYNVDASFGMQQTLTQAYRYQNGI